MKEGRLEDIYMKVGENPAWTRRKLRFYKTKMTSVFCVLSER